MPRDEEHPAKAAPFRLLTAKAAGSMAETRTAEDAAYDRAVGLDEYYRMLRKVRAQFAADGQKIANRARGQAPTETPTETRLSATFRDPHPMSGPQTRRDRALDS